MRIFSPLNGFVCTVCTPCHWLCPMSTEEKSWTGAELAQIHSNTWIRYSGRWHEVCICRYMYVSIYICMYRTCGRSAPSPSAGSLPLLLMIIKLVCVYRTCICMYMYVFEYQQPKTLEVLCIKLTDDWMSPHALADDRIAADKHRQGRNVSSCTTLGDLVHLTPVDGTILALVSD